jgi:hypothetical protein
VSGAQSLLGSVGWLYRYESWVLLLDGLACYALSPFIPSFPIWTVAIVLLMPRLVADLHDTPLAAQDRLLEHAAPARFNAQSFPGQTITPCRAKIGLAILRPSVFLFCS